MDSFVLSINFFYSKRFYYEQPKKKLIGRSKKNAEVLPCLRAINLFFYRKKKTKLICFCISIIWRRFHINKLCYCWLFCKADSRFFNIIPIYLVIICQRGSLQKYQLILRLRNLKKNWEQWRTEPKNFLSFPPISWQMGGQVHNFNLSLKMYESIQFGCKQIVGMCSFLENHPDSDIIDWVRIGEAGISYLHAFSAPTQHLIYK